MIFLIQEYWIIIPSSTISDGLFQWYYYGLNGIGGWLLFFLVSLTVLIWLTYYSGSKRLSAIWWRVGLVLFNLMITPSLFFRFTVSPIGFDIYHILKAYEGVTCPENIFRQLYPHIVFLDCLELSKHIAPMTQFGEIIFYLGLLGGISSLLFGISYWISISSENPKYLL